MGIQTFNLKWNNIEIEITYNDNWSKSFLDIYGHSISHLEIRSCGRQRLPITETGYCSHFSPAPDIADYGGVRKFVVDWLNHEAQSKAWKNYLEDSRQLNLF